MPHHTANWPVKLADWRRSGPSIAAWCRNNAVRYHTFRSSIILSHIGGGMGNLQFFIFQRFFYDIGFFSSDLT